MINIKKFNESIKLYTEFLVLYGKESRYEGCVELIEKLTNIYGLMFEDYKNKVYDEKRIDKKLNKPYFDYNDFQKDYSLIKEYTELRESLDVQSYSNLLSPCIFNKYYVPIIVNCAHLIMDKYQFKPILSDVTCYGDVIQVVSTSYVVDLFFPESKFYCQGIWEKLR